METRAQLRTHVTHDTSTEHDFPVGPIPIVDIYTMEIVIVFLVGVVCSALNEHHIEDTTLSIWTREWSCSQTKNTLIHWQNIIYLGTFSKHVVFGHDRRQGNLFDRIVVEKRWYPRQIQVSQKKTFSGCDYIIEEELVQDSEQC